MYDLGRVTGYIRINANDALAAYGKTRAAHASTMSALERSAMTTKRIGLAFGAVGAAALAGFGLAAKASADFEKRMSFVQALTKGSPAQMDKLKGSMAKLGQQFGITQNEMADAYIELAKAGAKTEQIAGGMGKATVTLARSADISAADAAKNIVGISATFEKGAKSAMHVADLLQGGANAAIIDVDDMAYSMRYAGSTAHTLGISLGDLTDVTTILGQANIRGSQAGTSLRRMMIQMTGPTQTARTALQNLGIITKDGANQFFNANGKLNDFHTNMAILRKAIQPLSKEQRINALNTIFGSRAIAAANVLLKTGDKRWRGFHDAVRQSSAESIAKKRLDNLSGAVDKFKAALSVAMVQAGSPAQKPLMQLVKWLTKLVQGFGNLSPATQQMIVRLVLLTGLFFTLSGAFFLATSFVIRFMQAWKDFKLIYTAIKSMRLVQTVLLNLRVAIWLVGRALMGLFLNPVGLTVLAIAALAIGLYELYKHWAPFRNMVNAVGKALVGFVKGAVSKVIQAFDWVKKHTALIAAALMVMFPMFAPFIALLYEIGHHWRGVWTGMKVVFGLWVKWIQLVIRVLVAYWKTEWLVISSVAKFVWSIIGGTVKFYMHQILSVIKGVLLIIKTVWKVSWALMSGMVKGAWHLIEGYAKLGWHIITNMVHIIAALLRGDWGQAWHYAGRLVAQAFHDIGHIITTFFKDAGHMLWDAGKALAEGLKNGIIAGAKSVYETVKHYLVDVPVELVKKGLGIFSPSRVMSEFGVNISQGLAQGIAGAAGHIASAMQGIVNMVFGATQDVVASVNTMIDAANSAYSNPYIRAQSTKLARLTGEADSRGTGVVVAQPTHKQPHFQYKMPKFDLGGADLGSFDGGGGSGSSGSKGSKKSKAKQKRVDLRALFQSGKWLMDGFHKGLESGSKGVRDFMKRLQERIKAYYNKAKSYGDEKGMQALTKYGKQVQRYGEHLLRLAQHRDKIVGKIEKQQKKIDDLMNKRANYAKDVANSIRDLGNLTNVITKVDASGNVDVSAENIVGGLQNTVDAVKEYDAELLKLRKMGLNKKTYNDLVQEGPEAGGAYARALLDGGKATIDQVNKLEAELNREAIKMGKRTSEEMYNSGIKAARGIIQGLRDKKGDITKVMVEVAHEMVKTLKKELGIKSPSRVMMRVGRHTTRGYALGILAEADRVKRAAETLGKAALPNVSMHSARGAGISAASLKVSATIPDSFARPDVTVKQEIRSTDPKLAADESARKMRTAAAMGVFG